MVRKLKKVPLLSKSTSNQPPLTRSLVLLGSSYRSMKSNNLAPELIHSIIALTQEFNSELRSLRKKNEFLYHY